MTAQSKKNAQLKTGLSYVALGSYAFFFIYVASIIIFDAWKLITVSSLHQRWIVALTILLSSSVVWLVSHLKTNDKNYKLTLLLHAFVLNGIATYSIYSQRGMSSRGVMLYTLPLLVIAFTYSRRAILLTALLNVLTYFFAAVLYFYDHPSEGYKVELYGEVAFYCGIIFVVAGFLWWLIKPKQ